MIYKEILEELIQTIESSAIDNKVVITNVKLWAESWRKQITMEKRKNYDKRNKYYSCRRNNSFR